MPNLFNLEELDLSKNDPLNISSIKGVIQLKKLNLSRTKWVGIFSTIFTLINLENLNHFGEVEVQF